MTSVIYFHHQGQSYPIAIQRQRRKDLRLRIKRSGAWTAVLPQRMPLSVLEAFLEDRRSEISVAIEKALAFKARVPAYTFQAGEILRLGGKAFQISHAGLKAGYGIKAVVDEDLQEIRLMPGRKSAGTTGVPFEAMAAKAVEAAAVAYGHIWLSERVRYFSKRMNLMPDSVKVGRAKGRYGSCSSKGSLNFCWRLLLAPAFVADYIVVHELAHLAQMNHSKAFYDIVAKEMPDYPQAQSWLKNNSPLLEWPVTT